MIALPSARACAHKIADAPPAFSWNPLNLGNTLMAWWTASEGVAFSSGSNVSTWTDQKNSYVATATGSGNATLTSSNSAVNNKPTIDTNGTKYFTLPRDLSDSYDGESQISALVFLKRNVIDDDHAWFDIGGSPTLSRFYAEFRTNNTILAGGRSNILNDGFVQDISTATVGTTWGLYAFEMDVANDRTQTYINNVGDGAETTTAFFQNTFDTNTGTDHTLFAYFDGSGGIADFEVAEVIFTKNRLTDTQKDQIAWYLNDRYDAGITYLIADPSIVGFESPDDLSGLGLWIDGADTSSYTLSGTTLTALTDKSPEEHTITVVNSPKVNKTYNGLNCISLENTATASTNSYFKLGRQITDMIVGKSGLTIFALVNLTTDKDTAPFSALNDYQKQQILLDSWLINDSTRVRLYFLKTGANYLFTNHSTSGSATRKTSVADGNYDVTRLLEGVADVPGQSLIFWKDGAAMSYNQDDMNYTGSTFQNTYSGDGTDTIGAEHWTDGSEDGYPRGGAAFIGDILELIVYTRALTTDERRYVRDYLSAKWGVTVA